MEEEAETVDTAALEAADELKDAVVSSTDVVIVLADPPVPVGPATIPGELPVAFE